MSDSWTMQLTKGLAVFLDQAGIGNYKPDTTYLATDTAIVFGKMPASPDQVLCLTPYGPIDDTHTSVAEQMIQMRVRMSTFTDVMNVTDHIRDLLHRRSYLELDTITISRISRRSAAYMGVDSNGRHEYSSNFRLTASRPLQPVGNA